MLTDRLPAKPVPKAFRTSSGGHATEEAGHETGDGDHEHGVEPQREADDHHQDAEEDEHALRLSRGGRRASR